MAIGRGIDENGDVFYVALPTTEQVLDTLLEMDRRRAYRLERDLLQRQVPDIDYDGRGAF